MTKKSPPPFPPPMVEWTKGQMKGATPVSVPNNSGSCDFCCESEACVNQHIFSLGNPKSKTFVNPLSISNVEIAVSVSFKTKSFMG